MKKNREVLVTISTLMTVVFLHVALGLFIAKAYFGDTKEKIGKKD